MTIYLTFGFILTTIRKGKLVIKYSSLDELDGILDHIK